jgi:hypothetical protein
VVVVIEVEFAPHPVSIPLAAITANANAKTKNSDVRALVVFRAKELQTTEGTKKGQDSCILELPV